MWHGDDQRKEEGATLVEFAFVAPFLFLLLFAIVEFALLTASFTGVWTAAREGASYATTVGDSTVTPGTPRYLDCDGIRNAAQSLVTFGEPTDAQIAINYFDPAGTQIADCNTADSTYPTPNQSLVVSGIINGGIHSNGDVKITGSSTEINGIVTFLGSSNYTPSEQLATPPANPLDITISEFAPGGARAATAAATGNYINATPATTSATTT